jgi:hypothetical protein
MRVRLITTSIVQLCPLRRKVLTVRLFKVAATLLLAITTVTADAHPQASARQTQTDSWFKKCSKPRTLGLEVLLNNKVVHRSSFPICRTTGVPENVEAQKRIVEFYFSGGHVFQDQYRTTASQKIEGNIWQAGAESNAILLGVSFMTKNHVLLNTIHAAKCDKVSTSLIDRGIAVRTFPVPPKR